MRLTHFMVVLALCAPMAAVAQTKRPTRKPAPATGTAQPHRPSVHDQFTGQGYGLAGCGLGSVLLGPKPGWMQVVAGTLNGISGNQTFGITTGTLNCDMPEDAQQAAAFIEVNREVLAKDASRGQGETIEGLAALLKCSDVSAFSQNLQENFGTIFKTENNSYEATRAILSTIQSTPSLQATCHTNS